MDGTAIVVQCTCALRKYNMEELRMEKYNMETFSTEMTQKVILRRGKVVL